MYVGNVQNIITNHIALYEAQDILAVGHNSYAKYLCMFAKLFVLYMFPHDLHAVNVFVEQLQHWNTSASRSRAHWTLINMFTATSGLHSRNSYSFYVVVVNVALLSSTTTVNTRV